MNSSSVEATVVGTHVVLSPDGPLMGGTATEALHSVVKDRISAGQNRIVVDLGRVPWLNSSGIGTLMGCRTECLEAGGELVLANANPKIHQLLDTLNLSGLLICYDSIETATAPKGKAAE